VKYNKLFLIVTVALSLATISLVNGCSDKAKNDQFAPKDKDTLIRGNSAEPPTLDPAEAQDQYDINILYDLFEGLTNVDQNDQIIPGIASSWEISHGGKVYTFHIRDNAKWSNGQPVTAQDFIYAWQRAVAKATASPYAYILSPIVNADAITAGKLPASSLGAKALDAHTLQVTLVRPVSYFLQSLTMPVMDPLYAPSIKQYGDSFTQPGHLVSNGAYYLSEWVKNGYLAEKKNPYYYDAKDVKIDNVKFLPIFDTNSELAQYKSGGIDITYTVPVDQYNDIKAQYADQLHTVLWAANYYYDLNMKDPAFAKNPKLRQALSMAIDRTTLANTIVGGGRNAMYTFIPPTMEGGVLASFQPYSWQTEPYAQQAMEAKKLFNAAGYSTQHPLVLTVSYNTNDLNKKVALALASMWQQAFGENAIQVKLNNQEWGVFMQSRIDGTYQVARDAWLADVDTLEDYTDLPMCKNPQNDSHYCNPKYDQLVNEAEHTLDPAKRIELIKQSQTLLLNDYPVVPLFQDAYSRLMKPYVKGYDPTNNHLDHVESKWMYFDYGN